MKGSCCKLGRKGTLFLCCVWPSGLFKSKLAVGSPCYGIRYLYSCLRTTTAAHLKVPSKSSSEGVSRTWRLPRDFGSSGTSADLVFKNSWNGAHHQLEPKWVTSPFQSALLYQYKSTKAQGQGQKYSICLWGRFPETVNKEVQVTHTGHKLLSTAQMMFSLWRTGISSKPEFGSLLLSFFKHQLFIKN